LHFAPACRTGSDQTNAGNGTTDGSDTITSPGFFQSADVARRITGTNISPNATVVEFINTNSVRVSGATTGSTTTATFTLLADNVDVSATAFHGTGGATLDIRVCNGRVAGPVAQGGFGDVSHGCDFGNNLTSVLDGTGNSFGPVSLSPPSSEVLTQSGGPLGTNSVAAAKCPPDGPQIAAGWTCVISVAQTNGAHEGYRVFNMKSPIPAKVCNGNACGATIPAGTQVELHGMRFPCQVIRPDDPSVGGNQGACLAGHRDMVVLVKRVKTGLLEGSAITPAPTSFTGAVNGQYTLIFAMPTLVHPGERYKLIPHAPACPPPGFDQGNAGYGGTSSWLVKSCESGSFNAAGVTVVQ
jgi:hypothetical protein